MKAMVSWMSGWIIMPGNSGYVQMILGLLLFVAAVPAMALPSDAKSSDSVLSEMRGVAIDYIADSLGYECSPDSITGGLQCVKDNRSVSFLENAYCYADGNTVRVLPSAPQSIEGKLHLRASLLKAALRFPDLKKEKGESKAKDSTVVAATDPVDESLSTSEPVTIMQVASNGSNGIRTIVVDPGHGGKDPGAIGPGGTLEKDVVLAVGLALQKELQAISGLTIHMTRTSDVFVELGDRTKFANSKGADLFVSLHANSIGGNKRKREQVKGYKVYFLSHAKSEDDRRVAMLENSVVAMEEKKNDGDFLQNILLDMTANEFLLESQDMSITIAESFAASLTSIKNLHTGVGQGPFWVLFGASMPSVLIEIGFISNPREEKLLVDSKVQQQLAKAIASAIVTFKKKYELGL